MTYAGIKSTQQRADVIAYLRTLSSKPVPLPSADEVAKAEQSAKPAEAGGAATAGAPAAAAAAAGGPAPIDPLLASADVQKGDTIAHQVCAVCHSLNEGGQAIVGPNLYGIVGAQHDHQAGFDYSAALQKFKGQPWTYEELNKWLYDPLTYAPGTRMTYAGLKSTQQRADLIAYLRSLSHNPAPLPGGGKAPEPTKAAETAPAPGTAAPAGNHSALGSASAPNSAPASSPNVIGPPGQAYNANAQTPNVGTQAGGTGAEPSAASNAPASNANKP
ncbi:MAG: c-type cytochrome [Acetobacteraceae bacterium]|nr:c-type cytochrome [Acetobacteraceae bacterium]